MPEKETKIETKLDASAFEVLPDGRVAVRDNLVAAVVRQQTTRSEKVGLPTEQVAIRIGISS